MKKYLLALILASVLVLGLARSWCTVLAADTDAIAFPSTQTVDIDGKSVEFQCYALKDERGNDTNYIKLRDLADILDGSAAQFEVGWNGSITITTGVAYTKNGTEQNTPFSGPRSYEWTAVTTLVNGQTAELDTFQLKDDNGGAYTYYKLRDLGTALGFKVDWSSERGIYIETGTAAPKVETPATLPQTGNYNSNGWHIDYDILFKTLPSGQKLTYYVNVKSEKFHCPTCRTIKGGTTEEYWYQTSVDFSTLIQHDYDPCGVCLK